MAGNMDTSFGTELTNINQKIKEFPNMEVENALNNTVSALSQSVAKKQRFTQMQEKELMKLEQEVKYLEKEVITKEEILKSKKNVIADEERKYKSVEEIHKEIEKMEEKADNDDVSSVAEITQLTIFVPDEVFRELGPGLDRVVSDKSLQGLYRILGPYSQWSQHRQDTFDYFCRTYPDLTSVMEKENIPFLLIQNHKNTNRTELI
ncbi:hypothetical protein KUTeg_021298 [Tegillarca granosa]|uniref:Uncharacterized protein n=1 Tax=Tegillarca granosa TaxID=220873 RepID=A0ABQ9ED13_TEGGR|nr:hypothetical protein KUTeg_021298 [Tegillarca granosa]